MQVDTTERIHALKGALSGTYTRLKAQRYTCSRAQWYTRLQVQTLAAASLRVGVRRYNQIVSSVSNASNCVVKTTCDPSPGLVGGFGGVGAVTLCSDKASLRL